MPFESAASAELAERLRNARVEAGLTQEEVAERLKLARTTVVAIENGSRRVRDDELLRLAELYKVHLNALLHRRSAPDLSPKFRRAPQGRNNVQATLESTRLLQRLVASYVDLEARLGRSLKFEYPPERSISRGRLGEQAEDLALEFRNRYGLGLQPIENLTWLAENEVSIRVFERPLPSSVSGAFAYDASLGACVLLNLKHPRARRTMTLGHEIGHLLTNREVGEVLEAVEREEEPEERFCTYFALALLMPAAAIRRRYAELAADGKFSTRNLVFLARSFHVTTEAMCRRLEQLEILKGGTYDLIREQGYTESKARELLGDLPELPGWLPAPRRFGLLAAEAYEKGLISEGQATDILGLDRIAVREVLDALGTDSEAGHADA